MTTTSGKIAKTSKRNGNTTFRRFVSPSGGNVQEAMLDFLMDIDTDILSLADIETLETLFDDLDYLNNVELNEALHRAKKSTTGARTTARKWYKQNKARVKKLQSRLKKSKGLQKKKEIMAKSGRNLSKKRKKKYNTKDHVNEYGFYQYLKENLKPEPYRVIQEFAYDSYDGSINVELNDTLEYFSGQCFLEKRNGDKFKLSTVTAKDFQWMIESSYIKKLVRRI